MQLCMAQEMVTYIKEVFMLLKMIGWLENSIS